MPHHTLTLNYNPDGFRPDVDVLLIATGDTVSFQLGTAPPRSSFKITIVESKFFSPWHVSDSDTKVKVVEAVKTDYQCQLFDENGKLLSSPNQAGASMRPV